MVLWTMLGTLLLLAVCVTAGTGGYHGDTPHTNYEESHKHNIRDVKTHRTPLHDNLLPITVQTPCKTDGDCFPRDYANSSIPRSLIACDNTTGLCTCNECFVLVRDACQVADCHRYDSKCRDDRKSQKTAFLLTLFLSSVGAANFYIEQEGLAGGQLALLLSLMATAVLIVCWFCCVACIEDTDNDLAICCVSISGIVITLSMLLLLIGIACWWVADLVAFKLNSRKDGSGCPLLDDL